MSEAKQTCLPHVLERLRLLADGWRNGASRCTNDPASPSWLIACAEDVERLIDEAEDSISL